MKVERLTQPTPDDIADILNLFKKILSRTCSAAAFLAYLDTHWINLHLSCIRYDNGTMVAFQLAVAPSILEPTIGWLPFSYAKAGIKHKFVQQGLDLAEAWLRDRGARTYQFTSVRKPRALKRVYNMTPSKEVLYEKHIK